MSVAFEVREEFLSDLGGFHPSKYSFRRVRFGCIPVRGRRGVLSARTLCSGAAPNSARSLCSLAGLLVAKSGSLRGPLASLDSLASARNLQILRAAAPARSAESVRELRRHLGPRDAGGRADRRPSAHVNRGQAKPPAPRGATAIPISATDPGGEAEEVLGANPTLRPGDARPSGARERS